MYGITETTVHVSYRPVSAADVTAGVGSVVGCAIPDLGMYLLDRYGNLVPRGVVGEIYVSGAGVVRGYLDRPGLTAERFVPDPFSGEPGARLYRSGDLARWRADGDLEYMGRADAQIKIRGFRVEPGEVETALRGLAGVVDAAVVARDGGSGEKMLVGYLVMAPVAVLDGVEARRLLGERLPGHMVPGRLMTVAALPLTAHGKLDVQALPVPDAARGDLGEAFVGPRTLREELLAGVWGRVLGVERVGVHDNFFALGGDSIRAVRVVARCRELGMEVGVVDVFRHPTVGALATVVREGGAVGGAGEGGRTAPFSLLTADDRERLPQGVEDAYPLATLQLGMIYHGGWGEGSSTYHDVFSYRIRLPYAAAALREALAQIVRCHPLLRAKVDLVGYAEPLQMIYEQVALPLAEERDLRGLGEEEQEQVIDARLRAERSVSFGPGQLLWRAFVHERGAELFQFSLSFHHALLDGWSAASLFTELFACYRAVLAGRQGAVTAPASLYRDFVAAERAVLAGGAARAGWQRVLSGAESTLMAGPERDGVAVDRQSGRLVVADGVLEGLRAVAAAAGAPLKSVLLAVHLRVLGLILGRADVMSGVVTNGRLEQTDGDRCLGLFLNTLPVRARFAGGTWLEWVRQVFVAEQEMLALRRCPLAAVVQACGGAPLFDVVFNYTDFHVYDEGDGLQAWSGGGKAFEQTSFPMGVSFGIRRRGDKLGMQVVWEAARVQGGAAEAVVGWYEAALQAATVADGDCQAFRLSRAAESGGAGGGGARRAAGAAGGDHPWAVRVVRCRVSGGHRGGVRGRGLDVRGAGGAGESAGAAAAQLGRRCGDAGRRVPGSQLRAGLVDVGRVEGGRYLRAGGSGATGGAHGAHDGRCWSLAGADQQGAAAAGRGVRGACGRGGGFWASCWLGSRRRARRWPWARSTVPTSCLPRDRLESRRAVWRCIAAP